MFLKLVSSIAIELEGTSERDSEASQSAGQTKKHKIVYLDVVARRIARMSEPCQSQEPWHHTKKDHAVSKYDAHGHMWMKTYIECNKISGLRCVEP